jgi:outer membrane immunogenic protein
MRGWHRQQHKDYLMKRLATLTAAIALMSGAAFAADLSGSMKDSGGALPAAVNWSGLYAGVNGGYFSQDGGITNNWLLGGTVGLNLQRGHIVGGIETDLDVVTSDWNTYYGTVRGRLGLATGNWLLYGTGGYAYAGTSCAGYFADGWAAGLGTEVKVAGPWSVKVEWLHTELDAGGGAMPPADVFRTGINFPIVPMDQLH